jgi:BioD-like phosphotransacetylase family protein
LKSIKSIFGTKISYFSPISASSAFDSIEKFLKNNRQNEKINYKDTLEKYNKEQTAKEFWKIIN